MKSNRRFAWIQVKIDLREIWLVEVYTETGNDFLSHSINCWNIPFCSYCCHEVGQLAAECKFQPISKNV